MAAFTFTSNALEYKYEIYNQDGHGSHTDAISGILIGDHGTTTKWDTDLGVGGGADYKIKYYVKVNDAADSSIINLETIDVTLGFDSVSGGQSLFKDFAGTKFTAGTDFTTGVSYDFLSGDKIRFTGAVLDKVSGGTGVASSDAGADEWTELFTLEDVTINSDAEIENLLDSSFTKTVNVLYDAENPAHVGYTDMLYEIQEDNTIIDLDTGLLVTEEISDTLTAKQGELNLSAITNIYDTVVSDRAGSNTADILSLEEADVTTAEETDNVSELALNKVTLHEAKSQFEDFGTNIYTQRHIGSDETTFLVRSGSTVTAETYWTNVGTYSEMLDKVKLVDVASSQISLKSGLDNTFVSTYLEGSSNMTPNLIEGFETQLSTVDGTGFDTTPADKFKLKFDVTIKDTVSAGTKLSDLDFFRLDGQNNDDLNGTNDISKVTKNVVTFQGDLNFDGRVSLKDLAFLNAGKLAFDSASDFDDVDADFDGNIDTDDLAVLSAEWNSTIHGSIEKTDLLSTADSRVTTWSTIDSEVVNVKADTANLTAFAGLNDSITYANSSFDHQDDVETAHLALVGTIGGPIAIADMVSGF